MCELLLNVLVTALKSLDIDVRTVLYMQSPLKVTDNVSSLFKRVIVKKLLLYKADNCPIRTH